MDPQSFIKCIYCFELKTADQFSLEHVIPKAIGGTLLPDELKTSKVCKRCNNVLGQFVDGQFLKGYFRHNEDAMAAHTYIDFEKSSILPLTYLGELQEPKFPNIKPNEVCELWLSPSGDSIYHIHKRDSDFFKTYVGGNPIERKSDPGIAYFFLATLNDQWRRISIMSFHDHFKLARRLGGNIEIVSPDGENRKIFHSNDAISAKTIKKLDRKWFETKPRCQIVLQTDFEERFMAKIALGVGASLFGNAFSESPFAMKLRNFLWAKTIDDRNKNEIGIGGFFDNDDDATKKLMTFPGGYVLALIPSKPFLILTLNTPSGRRMVIPISDEIDLYKDRQMIRSGGEVYVLVPQLDECVGPIAFPTFISHQIGNQKIKNLKDIEARKIDPNSLPLFC